MGTTDNERTRTQLETLFTDNSTGEITAQDTRDLIATAQGGYWSNFATADQTFGSSGNPQAISWGGESPVKIQEGVDVAADGASIITSESGGVEIQRNGVYELCADIYRASIPEEGTYYLGLYYVSGEGTFSSLHVPRKLVKGDSTMFISVKLVIKITDGSPTRYEVGLSNDSEEIIILTSCQVQFSVRRIS